jgi:hypothetical protein
VAVASFVFVGLVGAVVFVAFRRQTKIGTDSETWQSDSAAGLIPFQSAGDSRIDPAEHEIVEGQSFVDGNPGLRQQSQLDNESTYSTSWRDSAEGQDDDSAGMIQLE